MIGLENPDTARFGKKSTKLEYIVIIIILIVKKVKRKYVLLPDKISISKYLLNSFHTLEKIQVYPRPARN